MERKYWPNIILLLFRMRRPRWIYKLLEEGSETGSYLWEMLAEIYRAIRGWQYWLALMGIRALLEQVIIVKVGDQGSFMKNLNVFYDKGPIGDALRALGCAIHTTYATHCTTYEVGLGGVRQSSYGMGLTDSD